MSSDSDCKGQASAGKTTTATTVAAGEEEEEEEEEDGDEGEEEAAGAATTTKAQRSECPMMTKMKQSLATAAGAAPEAASIAQRNQPWQSSGGSDC